MVFSVLSLIVVELIRVSKMLHFVSMEFNVCILIPNLKSHFFIFASFNILVLFSVQILIVWMLRMFTISYLFTKNYLDSNALWENYVKSKLIHYIYKDIGI